MPWEAIRSDGEHGGPEECFTHGIDRQGDERASEAGHTAHQIEADAGEDGTHEKDADRFEAEFVFDKIAAETQGEHECGREDEEFGAVARRQDGILDVLNPKVGAEFDCADQRMNDEEDKKQGRPDGPTTGASEGQQHDAAQGAGDVEPGVAGPGGRGGEPKEFTAGKAAQQRSEAILEEQEDEEANQDRAENADIAQHLAEFQALLGGFRFWKVLAEEQEAIKYGRNEEATQLDLPTHGAEALVDKTAQPQSRPPGSVQEAEIMGATVRKKGGDERVGHGFERAVGDGKEERARPQINEGRLCAHPVHGSKGDERGKHMQREGHDDQFAVADLVGDDPADDDAEAEPGEAGAVNQPGFQSGEIKVLHPIAEDAAADGCTDTGGQDGHKPGDEEPFGVRCDPVCVSITHSFVWSIWFWSEMKRII